MFDSEPRLAPPDDPPIYIADCKHEVSNGDDLEVRRGCAGGVYEYKGENVCPECAEERFAEWVDGLTLRQKMDLIGARFITLEELK